MSLLDAVRIGSQRPTWHRSPSEVVSSAGDEAIDLAKAAGLELDDWQQWVLRGSLGERRDHTWSAFEVAVILGRQNGKNAILEARELAGIVLFGDDLITHTAHRADTTLEHFRRMERYAEEFDEFGKLVKHVSHKNGDESIEIKGGRRIKFISRARQPGRGFSGSCVVFDEALYIDPAAIGAIIPTLATRPMAQVWYTSSAPKANSTTLHAVTARGRGSDPDDRLFFAEWGNEPGTNPDDVDAWYRANPGLGIRISEEYIRAERRLMSGNAELEGEFLRERVGVAEQPDSATGPISVGRWDELTDRTVQLVPETVRLALDAPWGAKSASFCVAAKTTNGLLYVELRDQVPNPELRSLVTRAKELSDGHGTPVIVAAGSPAEQWLPDFRDAGVPVDEMKSREYAAACGYMLSTVQDAGLRHNGAPELRNAVVGLSTRVSGDVEVWARRNSSTNIAPFVAATCALARVPVAGKVSSAPFAVFG